MIRCFSFITVVLVHLLIAVELTAQQSIFPSVKEAVDLALANNADVAVVRHNTATAEYGVRESKGNFLPKLNLIGSYTRNIDKPVIFLPEGFGQGGATEIGSDNNFNTYLDLSVSLYSKYNVTFRNYAQHYFYWQRANQEAIEQAVIANTRKAYFTCLLAVETVRLREKALTNAEYNHATIVHKVALGVGTEYDETAAKVRTSNFRNDLFEAEGQVIPVENALRLLLDLQLETRADAYRFTLSQRRGTDRFPNCHRVG
jgi:outer membrane protein